MTNNTFLRANGAWMLEGILFFTQGLMAHHFPDVSHRMDCARTVEGLCVEWMEES